MTYHSDDSLDDREGVVSNQGNNGGRASRDRGARKRLQDGKNGLDAQSGHRRIAPDRVPGPDS
ncbi:MAG: hypothetical protein NVSMB22_17550 [Chloroflexota bacterium]